MNKPDVSAYYKTLDAYPLTQALLIKNFKLADLLVEYGAKINIKEPRSDRVVSILTVLIDEQKEENLLAIEWLLNKGGNPHYRYQYNFKTGQTYLHSVVKYSDSLQFLFHLTEYLLRAGFDINAENAQQETLLDVACSNSTKPGRLDYISYLIHKGANAHRTLIRLFFSQAPACDILLLDSKKMVPSETAQTILKQIKKPCKKLR